MRAQRMIPAMIGALFFSAAASAATITIDGVVKTLSSFSIDANGAMVLTTSEGITPPPPGSYSLTVSATNGSILANGAAPAASYPSGTVLSLTASPASGYTHAGWSGDCVGVAAGAACSLTMNAAKSVGATFNPTGGGGGEDPVCGTTPSNVTVKDVAWNANTGNSELENLGRDTIIAYRITPSTSRLGDFGTAFTGGSKATRAVVISTCPGKMDTPVATTFCSNQGYEYAAVGYNSRAAGTANARYTCNLDTGKTYYINVKNTTLSNLTGNSCSGSNCPYYWTFR